VLGADRGDQQRLPVRVLQSVVRRSGRVPLLEADRPVILDVRMIGLRLERDRQREDRVAGGTVSSRQKLVRLSPSGSIMKGSSSSEFR
jgi:hypothetical protein